MIQDRHRVRIWDPVRKKMSYSERGWSGSHGSVALVEVYTGYEDSDEWKNYICMDCTGLKDSEGNLIWEGDVIKGPFDYGPGGWATRCGVVEWSNIHGYQWQYWQVTRCKVLGNIYENPDLLEAEK